MYGEMEMIRLRSEYDNTVEGYWKPTNKPVFFSGKRSYRRSSYYINPPQSYMEKNKFTSCYIGGKPRVAGATCLTVWSK